MRPLQLTVGPQRTGRRVTTRVEFEAASSAICSFTPLHSRVPSWGHGTAAGTYLHVCVWGGGGKA